MPINEEDYARFVDAYYDIINEEVNDDLGEQIHKLVHNRELGEILGTFAVVVANVISDAPEGACGNRTICALSEAFGRLAHDQAHAIHREKQVDAARKEMH